MAESITRTSGPKRVLHMGVVGYIIGLGVALLLLPLLPIFIALKLIDSVGRSRSTQ
mgnify:CR=1 FL=1